MKETELRSLFYLSQIFPGLIFILGFALFSRRDRKSAFKVREADLRGPRKKALPGAADPLAEAKMEKKRPLQLSGIRIDGAPHEVLGIEPLSSQAQIRQAYRELMRRYHPDSVGRPGSREWDDAQKIAAALNRAKEEMLKKFKTSPKN
jgi:DnaJ-domain-containing protein 1